MAIRIRLLTGHSALLAFGIGTSEVEHVLATQTLPQDKPKNLLIEINGALPFGVTPKDLILGVINQVGTDGGTGYVIEYAGEAIRAMSMEGRMTVCNMSIEAGAKAGMIAPDETTASYLKGRPFAPIGEAWDSAVEQWRSLETETDAKFDRTVAVDASGLEPFVTWGTSPEMSVKITEPVPDPAASPEKKRRSYELAMEYMGLEPTTRLDRLSIDTVRFIGSCTNSRIRTSARRQRSLAATGSPKRLKRWSSPAQCELSVRPRRKASRRCLSMRDLSGATPVARCAWR